jgi:peroxiredoxin
MRKIALICVALTALLWSGLKSDVSPSQAGVQGSSAITNAAEWEKAQAQADALRDKANTSSQAGNYADALTHVRKLVEISDRFPDKLEFREEALDFQHFLLMKNGAFQEAVETALALEALARKISTRNSPWYCLKIAVAYMGLNDREHSLAWIEKAVYERNFIRHDVLDGEDYSALKGDPRFSKVMAAVEKKIGLDLPARDFSIELLDGASFSLSGQRGKVVLVDFWDVNCLPCRKEMPNLKKLHSEFADKGLVIVGISLDTDKALLQKYLKAVSPEWKMACSFQGWNDATARLYSINATPSSWLIDRQGILRHVDLRGQELYQAVKALL